MPMSEGSRAHKQIGTVSDVSSTTCVCDSLVRSLKITRQPRGKAGYSRSVVCAQISLPKLGTRRLPDQPMYHKKEGPIVGGLRLTVNKPFTSCFCFYTFQGSKKNKA